MCLYALVSLIPLPVLLLVPFTHRAFILPLCHTDFLVPAPFSHPSLSCSFPPALLCFSLTGAVLLRLASHLQPSCLSLLRPTKYFEFCTRSICRVTRETRRNTGDIWKPLEAFQERCLSISQQSTQKNRGSSPGLPGPCSESRTSTL